MTQLNILIRTLPQFDLAKSSGDLLILDQQG